MIRACPASGGKGPYSRRSPCGVGGSITNPPTKLSRVPSFSLPIWWHSEQETPSAASRSPRSSGLNPRWAKTSPSWPPSFDSNRAIGMWQMEHSSSIAARDSG